MTYFSPDKPNSYGLFAPPYKAADWPISRPRDLNLMAAVLDSKAIDPHEVARIGPWLAGLRRWPKGKLSDGQRTYVSIIARQMGRLEFPEEFIGKATNRAAVAGEAFDGAKFKAWLLARKRKALQILIDAVRADAAFPSGETSLAQLAAHVRVRGATGPMVAALNVAVAAHLRARVTVAKLSAKRRRAAQPCSGVTSSSRPPVQPQPEHQAPRST